MRATWVGARSGRMSIATVPWVVSRMSRSAFSVMANPCLLELSVVDESQRHRASGERIAERVGETQGQAAGERLRERCPIQHALLLGCGGRLVGDARLAEQLAAALEAHHHG